LKAKLQSLPELANVSSDLQMSAPRVNVDNTARPGQSLNIDPEKIANTPLTMPTETGRANTIMWR